MTANLRSKPRESTHDPVCIYRDGPKWNDACPQCDLIAKVRADERERAAQRIEYLIKDNEYAADGVPVIHHWLIAFAAKVCRQGERP